MAAAQILSTRGFDNVYVLSGGLSGFAAKHPRNVEGALHATQEPQSQQGSSSSSGSGGGIHALLGKSSGGSQHGGGSQAGSAKSSALASMREQARAAMGGGSQHGSARSGIGDGSGGGGGLASARSRLGSDSGGLSRLALSRLGGGLGKHAPQPERLDEADERASRMSGASVAESVISRAQQRKSGMGGRYR